MILRNTILLILLLIGTFFSRLSANTIDSLKTKMDVEHFLVKNISPSYEGGMLFSNYFTSRGESLQYWHIGTDTFYKYDVDRNGLNDLIIDGVDFFIILDSGNQHYSKKFLRGAEFTFKGIKTIDTATLISVNVKRPLGNGTNQVYDTLIIYHDGVFMEYCSTPANHKIEKISFHLSPGFCMGCAEYTMKIDGERNISYIAYKFNAKRHSVDTIYANSVLPGEDYNRLISLLNYIRFDRLNDAYSGISTDLPTGYLNILYDSGKSKTIKDYGLYGTLGLDHIYDLFIGYYAHLPWEKKVKRGKRNRY